MRRLMLNSHRSGEIPSEYRAVSYIESSGLAYIDTGEPLTLGDTIEMGFYVQTTSDVFTIMGVRRTGSSTDTYQLYVNCNYRKSFIFLCEAAIIGNQGTTWPFDTWNDLKITTASGLTQAFIGDTLVRSNSSSALFDENGSSVRNPYLFAFNVNDTAHHQLGGNRMSYYRVSYNGVTKKDYRPVQRKIDGVYGMYDVVSRAFKTSPNGVLFGGV